jgi:hypothetical protein
VTSRSALATQARRPEHPGTGAGSYDWSPGPSADRSHSRSDSTIDVDWLCQAFYTLNRGERARVLRALSVPAPGQSLPAGGTSPFRGRMVCFLAVCCLGLIPWTIGLAVTLPRNYLVDNWPLAWVGFDTILLGCLGTTAWALWKQRQVAVVTSMVTSVLLLCDAWFDVVTAHSGRCLVLSITTAVLGEIPIGILLGLISIRLLHPSREAAHGNGSSPDSRQPPLRWPFRAAEANCSSHTMASQGADLPEKSTGVLSSQQRGEQ